MPERMAQYFEYSSGLSVKHTGVGLESGKALFYCTDVLPKFFRAAGFGLGQHGGQSGLVSRFYAGQGG